MEAWQRKHIQKNLVELIKNTTCNVELIAKLTAAEVLGQEDADQFTRHSLSPLQHSKFLYDILATRVGSFEILKDCLKQTKQSGALKILKEHSSLYRKYGRISYDRNHVLGTGCFGTKVYKGTFGGRDVAVKILNSDVVDPEIAQKEIEFLERLDNHENIIRYFTMETHDNFIYIALELCLISLQDEITLKLLNLEDVSILKCCTQGLAHLHKNNVIHRDLKPANILLNAQEQVKLSDFGLSKEIPHGATSVSIGSGVTGTLDWMAPEIVVYIQSGATQSGFKMTTACDIFSLGCVYFFVLSNGQHLFGEALHRQYHIMQHKPQDMSQLIDAKWVRLITKMISRAAKDRPVAKDLPLDPAFVVDNTSCLVHNKKIERKHRPRVISKPEKTRANNFETRLGNDDSTDLKGDNTDLKCDSTSTDLTKQTDKKEHESTAYEQIRTSSSSCDSIRGKADQQEMTGETPQRDHTEQNIKKALKRTDKKEVLVSGTIPEKNKNRVDDPSTLHRYLVDTYGCDSSKLKQTIKKVKLRLQCNPEQLDKKNKNNVPPILAPRMHLELLKFLIKRGANFMARDEYRCNVLHLTAQYYTAEDYHDLVLFLSSINAHEYSHVNFAEVQVDRRNLDDIHLKTDVVACLFNMLNVQKITDFKGVRNFPIYYAIANFEMLYATLELLRSKKVDMNDCDHETHSILHVAVCAKRNISFIKLLIVNEFCNVFSVDTTGNTFVHYLPKYYDDSEYYEVASLLLSRGYYSVFAAKNNANLSALSCAVEYLNISTKTLQLFRNNPISLFYPEKLWISLLSHTLKKGRETEIFDNFIMMGVKWYVVGNGDTFAHYISWCDSAKLYHEIVKRMIALNLGKMFREVNTLRKNPLHVAAYSLELLPETLELLFGTSRVTSGSENLTESTKEGYSDINAVDQSGNSVLHHAVIGKRSLSFVKDLVKFGADWTARNKDSKTLAHLAASHGLLSHLKYFVGLGCDVNALDNARNNVLHVVNCEHSKERLAMIEYLVGKGVDKSKKNKLGETAYECAMQTRL